MKRPVWLFSMDSDQFAAPPMATGGLEAYFLAYGRAAARTEIELVHFLRPEEVSRWLAVDWPSRVEPAVRAALRAGVQPVIGLSCYTWNAAEFLGLARSLKAVQPDVLVVAGGPQVQEAAGFLCEDGIDVVVRGEGEQTFAALLDCESRARWSEIPGLCFLAPDGEVHETPPRERLRDLDRLPSPLDVIELRAPGGTPRYRQAACETSRGCPYRCGFCEWGSGAIGTKIHQFALDRVRSDFERLVAGGVEDIWLCDSNFGALKEDLAKTEMIVELRRRTGRPRTFATSWSKNHNRRVQRIVRLLHRNGLLSHYHLGLQTLTPRALELSGRKNMRANDYEPIVRDLAAERIPVAAELIWGLPGDTLGEFEANLDRLMTVFPNINIFGYTLLPGTEFYARRREYRLETLPVAGYGKAKGEYVVGCHTFSRDEGEEGYFLITAYIVLVRGHIMPLAARFLALGGRAPVGSLLRAVMRALLEEFRGEFPELDCGDRMAVYERRSELYLYFLAQPGRLFAAISSAVRCWLAVHGQQDLGRAVAGVLEIDRAVCPRFGPGQTMEVAFAFAADHVEQCLSRMESPPGELLSATDPVVLEIRHPGRVGEVLHGPDGGAWMKGEIEAAKRTTGVGTAAHA